MLQWKYFDIIAKEVDEQNTINAVYLKLKKDTDVIDELLVVCVLNFSNRFVGAPAYLGSYLKFREPIEIRKIDSKKDNLNDLKKIVLSLPEEELFKLNDLFDAFLKMKAHNLLPKFEDYEEKLDLIFSKAPGMWQHRTFRTCLDRFSYEWTETEMTEKIELLNKLKLAGYDINDLIKDYNSRYNSKYISDIAKEAEASLKIIYDFENNLTAISTKNEVEDISFPNILNEEVEEYLIEMAARYNYFFAQKSISRKSEKTLRKESLLQDDLYFELAELCYKKYYEQ